MEYRNLGASGLRLSVLGFGTVTFGGTDYYSHLGSTDVAGARHLLDVCAGAGVNLLDTADVYSHGLAEETLGQALAGRRDRFVIATKARCAVGDGPNDAGLSRHHLLRACEASLRRLRTDHIDLYQLHGWDGQTPLHETMQALDTLVRQGKVNYVGVSNYTAWQLVKANLTATRLTTPPIVSHQVYYSLESRDAEFDLIPAAVDQGIGTLVWSPLAGGLLTGKYHRGADSPTGARHSTPWAEPPVRDPQRLQAVVECLRDIAIHHRVSAAQIALAWLLTRPTVTSLIVGARTPDQLSDNLAAANVELTPDECGQLASASAQPLPYPHWHQLTNARDRLAPGALALLEQHTP